MAEYQCIRCGHHFARSYDLKRHYQRKKKCFLTWMSVDTDDIKLPEGLTPELEAWFQARWNKMEYQFWNRIETFIDRLQVQYLNEHKRSFVPLPLKHSIRRGFGEETIDHLTGDEVVEIIKSGSNLLVEVLRKVHYHKDAPENSNIYCQNWRTRSVLVWEMDEDWHRVPFLDWWSSWVEQVEEWVMRWMGEHACLTDEEQDKIMSLFEDIKCALDWQDQTLENEDTMSRKSIIDARRRVQRIQQSVLHEICFQRRYFEQLAQVSTNS